MTNHFSYNHIVAWGDMDALGHVNNCNYFKYFESARIAFFNQVKLVMNLENNEVAPILANTSCQYLKPIYFPEELDIRVFVSSIGNTSFVLDYHIYGGKKSLLAKGDSVIVMLNYKTGEKVRMSDEFKQELTKYSKDKSSNL